MHICCLAKLTEQKSRNRIHRGNLLKFRKNLARGGLGCPTLRKQPFEQQAKELKNAFDVEHPKKKVEPKRPATGYQLFVKARYGDIKSKEGRLTLNKASKALSKMWKRLPEGEKKEFVDSAEKGREEFFQAHPKPPAAPKRPMNGYMLWANEERGKITGATKNYKVTEVAEELGKRWATLSVKERAKYIERSDAAFAKWKKDNPTPAKKAATA